MAPPPTRERLEGEIIIQNIQNSQGDRYWTYKASDLDLFSADLAQSPNGIDPSWLRFNLDQVYCIGKVIRYDSNGAEYQSWTCNEDNCDACVSLYCGDSKLTVSKSGSSTFTPIPDCKHGNIVTLARTGTTAFNVYEIAILSKPGKTSTYPTFSLSADFLN